MTEEELHRKRAEHLKKKLEKKRAWLFRETGMLPSSAENFYMCLFRNKKIDDLPESYSYLLPVESLLQKIKRNSNGFYFIEDSAVLEYKDHQDFHIIANRILDVICERNLEIDPEWHDPFHLAKYRYDYWEKA